MKLFFISLGCDKNLVDSEKMLGMLKEAGHLPVEDENEAEAAVINTCCFIHDAKQESIESILSVARLKETACLKYIIVTGCLAERYRQDILDEIPEVDAVVGASAYDRLCEIIAVLENGELKNTLILEDKNRNPEIKSARLSSSINHYTYLKIAEGCDKHCTYCVIPSIKGNYRSYPFEELVCEAEMLAKEGKTELVVIAQETTLYGTDLYGRKRLPELLEALCRIEGIEWIRLMYCYPEEIDEELIEVIKKEKKICKYIDIPIQSASDNVLKHMGRRTNRREITEIITRLRNAVPEIAIRTSLISGFPGETDEDHLETLDFIKSMKLDRVGVFTYSKEENTPAYRMKNQIKAAVKKKRRQELMLAQQECVFEKNEALIGKRLDVIIDGRIPEDNVYIGRSYMDAPGVDGYIFIEAERELISGSIINVIITDARQYDLIGREFCEDEFTE